MPKVDINAAFNDTKKESSNRRGMARKATGALLGGDFSLGASDFANESALRVQAIPFEKLREREINEFSDDADINSLALSIRQCGLISPLSVVHHPEEDIYVISAGHRRYKAISILRNEYPHDDRYKTVDCAVYEVTDDSFKLKQGLPYITKEQEESIYRDSNLESRQLSYEDVAKQIRYIVKRFEDPDYMNKIRDDLAAQGIRTYESHTDKIKLITNVLSTQKYSGWSRETIRQYLQIMDSHREDLLDKIEQGDLRVTAAYKLLVAEAKKSRKRKTTKITALRSAISEFSDEAKNRTYRDDEIKEIEGYIAVLQEIVDRHTVKE